MKCRKCSQQAAINMRQHKLALCRPHYLEWFTDQTERFIHKYRMFTRDERILVAVSGGKDSLALWDVLLKLGYHADGLYIDLGITGENLYSKTSLAKVDSFIAQRQNIRLLVMDVETLYGATIPAAADSTLRGRGRPCSVCGMVKRHIMNRVTREEHYDVLATGHNLDDEAAVLLGNTLTWQVDYLARQQPVLPASAEGLVRKVKPFFRFYERETAAYALLAGIDYVYDECPHAVGATSLYYKELLNRLEAERPGAKLQFFLNFLRAKEEGAFAKAEEHSPLALCPGCGQPTGVDGLCTFCRLWEQVRQRTSPLSD
jgi:uncharacterized protein (TIGR00269 family)